MTPRFEAKMALVTDGGTGIGRASALALAADGCILTVVGRTACTLEETVSLVQSAVGAARFVQCDVTDEPSVPAAARAAIGDSSRLDFGVNSAAVSGGDDLQPTGDVADLDVQRRFYGEALGLVEEAGRIELPQARIRTAILRGPAGLHIEPVERHESVPQEFVDAYDGAGTQGYFHWALAIGDLERAFDGVLAAGATQVAAPADASRPGVRYAHVKDPEGNLIELIQSRR